MISAFGVVHKGVHSEALKSRRLKSNVTSLKTLYAQAGGRHPDIKNRVGQIRDGDPRLDHPNQFRGGKTGLTRKRVRGYFVPVNPKELSR